MNVVTKLRAVWSFIAGDSKLAPLGVLFAVLFAVALQRYAPGMSNVTAVVFVVLIAGGLVAGVFERT